MPQLNNRRQKPSGGSWYSITAKDTGPVEMFIYDEIGGWGISAEAFVKDLRAHKGKDVTLRLHTPGGDVFGGQIIYNALRDHAGKVTTNIDGIVASMGSIIALAGNPVRMAENARFVIHNPFGKIEGEAKDMRKRADALDGIKETMASVYMEKTGKDLAEVSAWMDDETWFTAKQAKAAGFCDEIGSEIKMAAFVDMPIFKHAPEGLIPVYIPPKPQDERELEHVLTDAGFSRSEARAVVVRGYKGIGQCDADAAAKVGLYELVHTIRAQTPRRR